MRPGHCTITRTTHVREHARIFFSKSKVSNWLGLWYYWLSLMRRGHFFQLLSYSESDNNATTSNNALALKKERGEVVKLKQPGLLLLHNFLLTGDKEKERTKEQIDSRTGPTATILFSCIIASRFKSLL